MVVKSRLNECEEKDISIDSFEDSPHFSKLNETTKQLVGNMRKNDRPSTIIEPNEGDHQFMPGDVTRARLTLLKPIIQQSLMICGKTYVRPKPTSLLANSFKLHHLLRRR
jgi:hypothetical protein